MSYVLNETPTGTVNGVNTTFTTAQTLYQAVIITVDGVVYTGGVTFDDNDFTLADAPTVSITISYYTTATSIPVSGTLTVQSVYNAFARYKKDISDVSTATFLDWADWVNKFVFRHIAGIDPERFIETTTISATSGQGFAYLPTDFRDIQRFNCGLYLTLNSGAYQSVPQSSQNPNSNTLGYYIKNDRIYFTPTPVRDDTYQLRYLPGEPTIDELTDTFIAPLDGRYMDYLVKALDVYYTQWDEDVAQEGLADIRFTRLLDELSRNIKQMPAIYSFDDFSSIY